MKLCLQAIKIKKLDNKLYLNFSLDKACFFQWIEYWFYLPQKGKWTKFCSIFKIYVSMVLTWAFGFKIIRCIIFTAVRKVDFTRLRNFSTVKNLFHSQGTFQQLRNFRQPGKFSIVKERFHYQRVFPKSKIKELIFYNALKEWTLMQTN